MKIKMINLLNEISTKEIDDVAGIIYNRMNDDNFPENVSKKKLTNYVYKQFTLDTKTNKYSFGSGSHKKYYSKQDVEKIINKLEDDMQHGEGQHP